jgi:hypothetical protein
MFEKSLQDYKMQLCGRVAQLDRVPGYEPGGRRFESSRVRHFLLGSDISRQAVGFFVFKTQSMHD